MLAEFRVTLRDEGSTDNVHHFNLGGCQALIFKPTKRCLFTAQSAYFPLASFNNTRQSSPNLHIASQWQVISEKSR